MAAKKTAKKQKSKKPKTKKVKLKPLKKPGKQQAKKSGKKLAKKPVKKPEKKTDKAALKAIKSQPDQKHTQVKGKPQMKVTPISVKISPARKNSVVPMVKDKVHVTGEDICREVACEALATTGGYCRLHYIKNWKKIKRKELILKEKKLNQYIEELVAKYPDKYIEAIRQDLASDKDFAKVIQDLDLDESIDDYESDQEVIDPLIDNIKRDFEDEGEGF